MNYAVLEQLKSPRSSLKVVLLFAAAVLGTCQIAAQTATGTRPIRVGVLVDNYPFSYRDKDGSVKGFAYDLVREIERIANLKFERVEGTTVEINDAFREGKIDLLQSYPYSPERAATAEFSEPYIIMTGRIFVRKDGPEIKSLGDLKGRKVLVHRGSVGEELLRNAGLQDCITHVDSVEQALIMVSRGDGDATIAARLTGLANAYRLGLKNLKVLEIELEGYQVRYCIAVQKGEHALLARVNEALAILARTGKYAELYQKWFGFVTPHRYTKQQILGAISVGLAIALGVSIWAIIRLHGLTAQIKRQAEIVRESERKYRALFETANDAIFLIRQDRFVVCNARASAMFGCAREKLIGARPFDFSPPTQSDGRSSEEKAIEIINAAYSHGPQFFEWEHQRADGSRFTAEVSLNRLETGAETLLLAIVRDITERKRAEAAARETEERYRRLYESMMDAFVSTSVDGRIQEFNPAYREMLGYSEDELKQLTYMDLTPPKWHAFEAKIVEEQILPRGYSDVYEKEYRRKDGTTFPVELRVFLIRDATGQPTGMWAIVRDITERKRAEAVLREKEHLLSEPQRIGHIGSWKVELNGSIIWSAETYRIFGVKPESFPLTKEAFIDLIHPDDRHALLDWINKCHAGENPDALDFRIIRPDGTVRFLRGQGELVRAQEGNPCYLAGVVQDITEHKHAETVLRECEERFRLLAESSLVGIYLFQDDRFVYVNPALAAMFQYAPDEIVGKLSPLDLTHPDDWSLVMENIQRRIAKAVRSLCYEFRGLRKNGTVIYLESHGSKLNYRGRPAILGTLVDITERKQIEEALRESERKYRELVEHANSIILRWAPDGRITFLNEFGQRFFGYTQAEILGRHVVGTITPEIETGGRDLRALIEQICADPTAFEQNVNENMRRNGQRVWIAWTNKVVTDKNGCVVEILSIGHDITERLRAEAALHALTARLQEVREEECKRIARELHDELGQLLTGLKMDLHWVERDLEDKKPTSRTNALLEKIMGASELVDSAIKTVQRICAELRPTMLDKLGLVETLKYEARQFQERTRIKCRLRMPEPEPELTHEVAIACFRICQEALTNVARHAKATTVEIALRLEGLPRENNAGTAKSNCEILVLEIRDNGCGIPAAKLTDPQSLGLIGMQERARALGGTLTVQPGPNGGTIVTLSIPRTANLKTGAYESTDCRRPRNSSTRVARPVNKGIQRRRNRRG